MFKRFQYTAATSGRSSGFPVSFSTSDASVTICHSKTRDLPGHCRRAEERAAVAVELAARQVDGLIALGVDEFHFYTMNRSALVASVLDRVGLRPEKDVERARAEGAAA